MSEHPADMNAVVLDFLRQGKANNQKSCTGNRALEGWGGCSRSKHEVCGMCVPVISQPRTSAMQPCFLLWKQLFFFHHFCPSLPCLYCFLSLSLQSNCDAVYLRDAIQNTVVLYFTSSTSQHSRREAGCQWGQITNKAKSRSVQHFLEFDLLLSLTYTHTEPKQTILLHGKGLELNLSTVQALMKGDLLTLSSQFKTTSSPPVFQG